MYRSLFEKLKLIKPIQPHLPQKNAIRSLCLYCKGKKNIFYWEFGQFVECVICQEQTDV
jgi:hypothetical protein